jgi:hypothetical protein
VKSDLARSTSRRRKKKWEGEMINTHTLREMALLGMAYEKAFFDLGAEGDKVIERASYILGWLRTLPLEVKADIEDLLMLDKLRIHEDAESVLTLWVLCNDLFAWASADAEDFELSDLPELKRALQESPEHGELLWCCRKRGTRPQGPYYELFNHEEKALFDAAGPERKEVEEL